MKKFIIMFSIIFVFVSLPVHAYFVDGNDLVKRMREYEKSERSDPTTDFMSMSDFMGYVTGVYDVMDAIGSICAVNRITRGQISSIVTKFLNENPARWGEPARDLVRDALKNAFPCKK